MLLCSCVVIFYNAGVATCDRRSVSGLAKALENLVSFSYEINPVACGTARYTVAFYIPI
jgi:hypothetical protein